jgi:hypothetical protein
MKPDIRLVRLRTRRPAVASLRTGRSERVTQMIDPHDDRKIFGAMRGSSSNLGDCQWPRPPSRAEIPVDRESHGIRLVEGIGCARFQVAGKARAASCQLAGATGPP